MLRLRKVRRDSLVGMFVFHMLEIDEGGTMVQDTKNAFERVSF